MASLLYVHNDTSIRNFTDYDDEALELLFDAMQKYPDLVMVKELVGYTYYSMKIMKYQKVRRYMALFA